jgi:hypothetical protein
MYIILDGLDECDKSQLTKLLDLILPQLRTSFCIFATCRRHWKEFDVFSKSRTIEIEAKNEDVDKYVTEELVTEELENPALAKMIKETILSKTGGM